MSVYRTANKIILSSKLPNKIAGVNLWIDCNDMSTINSGGVIADGTTVTSVKDKINGTVFTATAGTLKVGSVITEKNVIQNIRMGASNLAGMAGATHTVFYVTKITNAASTTYFFNIQGSTYSNAPTMIPNFSFAQWGTGGLRALGSAGSVSPSWSYYPLSAALSAKTYLIATRKDTVKHISYCDGKKSAAASVAMTDATATNYVDIGNTRGNSTPFSQYLCEVIHANTLLSDKDFNSIRQYLINKWGV